MVDKGLNSCGFVVGLLAVLLLAGKHNDRQLLGALFSMDVIGSS